MGTIPQQLAFEFDAPEEKRCIACGETKGLSEFYLADPATGRRSGRCKPCYIARRMEYRRVHPEKRRAYDLANRDRRNERDRQRKVEDPTILERSRARYWRNAEEQRARVKRWREGNPLKRRAHKHARRARLKAAPGSYTVAQWEALKSDQGFACLMCGAKEPEITLTVDHVIPLAVGGSNSIENIQGLCYTCNNRKGPKVIDLRPISDSRGAP